MNTLSFESDNLSDPDHVFHPEWSRWYAGYRPVIPVDRSALPPMLEGLSPLSFDLVSQLDTTDYADPVDLTEFYREFEDVSEDELFFEDSDVIDYHANISLSVSPVSSISSAL